MRTAVLTIVLLLLIGLQVAWWPELTTRVMPAVVLAFVVAWSFSVGLRRGLAVTLAAGLLLDLYAQITFGRFTVAILLAVGVVALITRGAVEDLPFGYRLGTAAAAATAYEFWIVIVTNFTTDAFPFFAEFTQVATLNVMATAAAFALCMPPARFVATQLYPPHERPV